MFKYFFKLINYNEIFSTKKYFYNFNVIKRNKSILNNIKQ